MFKSTSWIALAGLIVGGAGLARSQYFPTQMSGGSAAQLPPEMMDMQQAMEPLMEEAAPDFYVFQKKLRILEQKIRRIELSLSKNEIDKETAKEKMLPLIKEERYIQNDPDYLCEQRLAQVYFSSPEYKKKAQEIANAFVEKKQQRPR